MKKPLFIQGENYFIGVGRAAAQYDPFTSSMMPDGDIYDEYQNLILSKEKYESYFRFFEIGMTYEKRLQTLLAGVIESGLQGEQKWSTDKFLHRHLVNVIDDQSLANLSGVGEEYTITLNELNAELTRRCNETVTTAMKAGNPVTFKMAAMFNQPWFNKEHDEILRNYIYTTEVDRYMENLNDQLFGTITAIVRDLFRLYDHEALPGNGWQVYTAKAENGVITIYNQGDFRALDWQFMRSTDYFLQNK